MTKPTHQADAVAARTAALFELSQNEIHRRADRLFANLMIVQWLAGIGAALWISPKTWIGATSQTHWHVWAAIFLGGAITGLPVYFAWHRPGRVLTRHTIAVAQMLMSALLIHLTGGRIETHFHVFGSLAFFAFYRDWRVLLTATVVVALDHAVRGIYWPLSAFGVLTTSPWRWIEHAGWVVFEDTFLFLMIRQSIKDMFEVAARRAGLEALNASIEHQVAVRTSELVAANQEIRAGEHRLRTILETQSQCVKQVAADGTLLAMNRAGLAFVEADSIEQVVGGCVYRIVAPEHREMFRALNEAVFRGENRTSEFEIIGLKGTRRWMQTHACALRDLDGNIISHLAVTGDITERKRAEAELAKAHEELLTTSRMAGMAEVATGVLHNVGNVLNSVNVSATVVADAVRKSRGANLSKVAAMLREHEAELGTFITMDPKGRQVPAFLGLLAENLGTERATILQELEQLQKNLQHIKDVVSMQQCYAKVSGVTETVNLGGLLADTLDMNAASFQRHDVEIVREFETVPPVSTDKHKLLQILVNLVRNAKQACDESGRADKRITLRLTAAAGCVRVSVADNGVGIPPENLGRIFNHGFTTKKTGHGFGLHSSANAIKEMGGTLTVHSDGPGLGTTFTVTLPVSPTRPGSSGNTAACFPKNLISV
ncbi:MAG: PAS domain-containing protein [Opitutaceae bacterium]|nr:PAS domain-containing protein [Opitutaceae bacterium]